MDETEKIKEAFTVEKKTIKIGLIPKLIIAIILGILFGTFLPEWCNRLIVTFSSIFSTFLAFVIPLMIVAYVTMGIAMHLIYICVQFLVAGLVSGKNPFRLIRNQVPGYATAIGTVVDTIYRRFIMKAPAGAEG